MHFVRFARTHFCEGRKPHEHSNFVGFSKKLATMLACVFKQDRYCLQMFLNLFFLASILVYVLPYEEPPDCTNLLASFWSLLRHLLRKWFVYIFCYRVAIGRAIKESTIIPPLQCRSFSVIKQKHPIEIFVANCDRQELRVTGRKCQLPDTKSDTMILFVCFKLVLYSKSQRNIKM